MLAAVPSPGWGFRGPGGAAGAGRQGPWAWVLLVYPGVETGSPMPPEGPGCAAGGEQHLRQPSRSPTLLLVSIRLRESPRRTGSGEERAGPGGQGSSSPDRGLHLHFLPQGWARGIPRAQGWVAGLADGCPELCLEGRGGLVVRDGRPYGHTQSFSRPPAPGGSRTKTGHVAPSSPASLEPAVSSGTWSAPRTGQQGLPGPPDQAPRWNLLPGVVREGTRPSSLCLSSAFPELRPRRR